MEPRIFISRSTHLISLAWLSSSPPLFCQSVTCLMNCVLSVSKRSYHCSNPGDFRRGEHLLLSGRIQNNTSCGTAFRVDSVERVWANSNHRQVLFDRRYDGEYYDRSGGRYGRNDDRYDRYDDRYDDRYGYDPDGRRSIAIDGRLDDSGDCPVVRGDRGEYYDLVGDLSRFQDGRHVRVAGRDPRARIVG